MNKILRFPNKYTENLFPSYNIHSFIVEDSQDFWDGVELGRLAQQDDPILIASDLIEEFSREIKLRNQESDDHIFGYLLGRIEKIFSKE